MSSQHAESDTATSGSSRVVLGTCHHDCPDSCGWQATVNTGTDGIDVVTKLRGNPQHPFSKGELCPKVNRFVDRVYSPDRILYPLIRSGPKGSASFERASWDEALAHVAKRLHEILESSGGEAIYPWWDAGTQGLLQMSSLDRRFFTRLGASRLIGSLCGNTAGAGVEATYGTGLCADPADARFAKLIVLWGTNTRLTNRHLWPFIEEARSNGAQIVVVDPMKTLTAESADTFIQPLPGTDVALMLAMMHVLIRDGLIDHSYVNSYAVGFDELADHVRSWTPERAAEVCGLDPSQIEQFASDYGTAQPSFIRTLIGAEHHEHGAMFFRAMACLPVLTGAWRHRGGGMARSVGSWFGANINPLAFEAPELSQGTPRRSFNMNHLGRTLTEAHTPSVEALFVWNGNPAVTVPNSSLIRQGLEREDLFTVVSEQFMTDTAHYADVVLPAATQLEQLDVVPAWGHLYLGWNEPAIAPLGEAVPNTELWRRLARAMGYTEPALFESDESLLDSALVNVDRDRLRSDGFVRIDVPQDLRPYANGEFETASGKAELYSERLAAEGHHPLPEYLPAIESPGASVNGAFPLRLATPKTHTRFLNSSYSHLPKHGPPEGGPFIELDAADAEARGLSEGDRARVWNDRASLTLTVKITERVRPGLVAVPFGWWSADHQHEGTANDLTSDRLTDWGGGVAFGDTLVEVAALDERRVGEPTHQRGR